jgi:RNA ligase (TIGR02306 family)
MDKSGGSKTNQIIERGITMSTFEVTIETINVFPHPNAERLELARVGLYNIVVGKGTYNTGDKVIYIPEFAVLPEGIIETLGLVGKLAGSAKNRVKPIALRGSVSQGLVAPLSILPENAIAEIGEDGDFSEILGIKKWQPEVPEGMSGEREGNVDLIPWIDIENLKKFPDLFEDGEMIAVDEKVHGTASLYTFINPTSENPEILVSSKGLGSQRLVIKPSNKVLYWNVLSEYKIQELARFVAENFAEKIPGGTITKVAIFGETYGQGVQDLNYGRSDKRGFLAFDIFFEYKNAEGYEHGFWLNPSEVKSAADAVGVPIPPRLYEGPFSLEIVEKLAYGPEQVSGTEAHIREGVVIRPVERPREYSDGSHRIAKYVSDDYLTRKDATEYQ